MYQEEPEENLY